MFRDDLSGSSKNIAPLMKTLRLLLLAFCACVALNSARATTVIPPTFDELVSQAEIIFQGTVTEVKSQWTGEGAQRHIVSYVTFQVDEAVKGDAGATYTLRLLGGTVDGQTMEVTDTPKFKAGDRDIVFVENNGTQFIPLVGIMHGRFRVREDKETGAEVVVDNSGQAITDLAHLGHEQHEAHGKGTTNAVDTGVERTLAAADFKAAIKAKLAR